jgi:hypothetical protein
LDDRLAKLELENELLRIDREWEQERKKHMVNQGRWGGLQVPTKRMASLAIVLLAILAGTLGIGYVVVYVLRACNGQAPTDNA